MTDPYYISCLSSHPKISSPYPPSTFFLSLFFFFSSPFIAFPRSLFIHPLPVIPLALTFLPHSFSSPSLLLIPATFFPFLSSSLISSNPLSPSLSLSLSFFTPVFLLFSPPLPLSPFLRSLVLPLFPSPFFLSPPLSPSLFLPLFYSLSLSFPFPLSPPTPSSSLSLPIPPLSLPPSLSIPIPSSPSVPLPLLPSFPKLINFIKSLYINVCIKQCLILSVWDN